MHLGLIIDGNRRWAKQKGLNKYLGHKKGMENLEKILEYCHKRGDIDFLTVFTLSTENIQREQKELDNLFNLIVNFAKKWKKFQNNNIRVKILGDITVLPEKAQKALENLMQKTNSCDGILFCPAINYGGQAEIVRAFNRIKSKNLKSITNQDIIDNLDAPELPPMDLMIRTGGKKRISNFTLWHLAYAELFFSDKMWPDFSAQDLEQALAFLDSEQRNFGK